MLWFLAEWNDKPSQVSTRILVPGFYASGSWFLHGSWFPASTRQDPGFYTDPGSRSLRVRILVSTRILVPGLYASGSWFPISTHLDPDFYTDPGSQFLRRLILGFYTDPGSNFYAFGSGFLHGSWFPISTQIDSGFLHGSASMVLVLQVRAVAGPVAKPGQQPVDGGAVLVMP
jgi:hypothetical protein